MRPVSLDDYLDRLERALHQRGVDDARILDEAREHLVDAIDHARQSGLSVEDAMREAVERFGAPEVVAAHVAPDGQVIWRWFASVWGRVWHRKWWIAAPTVLSAVLTSVLSYYFLPTRYRSESVIQLIPARVSADYVRPTVPDSAEKRLDQARQGILSQTRLERIINDFGLYKQELERATMSDVVRIMRRHVDINLIPFDAQGNGVARFTVSFEASEPKLAMQVTDRFASFMVEELLRDRQVLSQGAEQFIKAQIEDVRGRIVAYEGKLKGLRAANGFTLSQAELLPYEVLKERYRALLIQAEESRTAMDLEQRQIGEQFRLLEPARLPERPMGPSRLSVNLAGGSAGFGLGLLLALALGRPHRTHGSGGTSLTVATN